MSVSCQDEFVGCNSKELNEHGIVVEWVQMWRYLCQNIRINFNIFPMKLIDLQLLLFLRCHQLLLNYICEIAGHIVLQKVEIEILEDDVVDEENHYILLHQ